MTTLNEMIEIIKAENPTIRIGDEDAGYTELSPAEYNAQILDWANARLAKQNKIKEAEELRQIKISAYQKLGLTDAEIEAIVPAPKAFKSSEDNA